MNDIRDNQDNRLDTTGRPVSVTHLVLGLVFLGIAGMWLLAAATDISGPDLTISGPVVLIAAGVIGLAASVANARRRRTAAQAYDPYHSQEQ
ncbi:MAG TPA: hypothetical protein VFO98_11755 [Marmoricola sp.]|jgi:protein-S-isoprenylcysteine O-methyltransferase Ste14|nr:hypothetical protein [Marmoricola sp.]